GRRVHDDRVLHRAGLAELGFHRADRRRLLPDGNVDADDAGAFLVDNRVDRDRGLADAAVANDELALAAADRDHRVDGLESRLQRLFHRLADDDARGVRLDLPRQLGVDRAESIEGTTETVDHAADELRTDRNFEHAGGAAHLVALAEHKGVAEDDRADVVLFEIQRQRRDNLAGVRCRDLEHLAGHRFLEAIDTGDAVLDLENAADLFNVELV